MSLSRKAYSPDGSAIEDCSWFDAPLTATPFVAMIAEALKGSESKVTQSSWWWVVVLFLEWLLWRDCAVGLWRIAEEQWYREIISTQEKVSGRRRWARKVKENVMLCITSTNLCLPPLEKFQSAQRNKAVVRALFDAKDVD